MSLFIHYSPSKTKVGTPSFDWQWIFTSGYNAKSIVWREDREELYTYLKYIKAQPSEDWLYEPSSFTWHGKDYIFQYFRLLIPGERFRRHLQDWENLETATPERKIHDRYANGRFPDTYEDLMSWYRRTAAGQTYAGQAANSGETVKETRERNTRSWRDWSPPPPPRPPRSATGSVHDQLIAIFKSLSITDHSNMRKCYLKAAHKLHPDKNPGKEDEFKVLSSLWTIYNK